MAVENYEILVFRPWCLLMLIESDSSGVCILKITNHPQTRINAGSEAFFCFANTRVFYGFSTWEKSWNPDEVCCNLEMEVFYKLYKERLMADKNIHMFFPLFRKKLFTMWESQIQDHALKHSFSDHILNSVMKIFGEDSLRV